MPMLKTVAVASSAVVLASAESSSTMTNSKSSPVGKVIELIDELKVKVQKDLSAEEKAMASYTEFCDDEQTQKGFAIKTAGSEIEGFKAVIEETSGAITQLAGEIDAAGSAAAAKNSELSSATKIRE